MFFTLNGINERAEDMLKHSENFQIQVLERPIKVALIRVRPEVFGFPQRHNVPRQFDHHEVVQGRTHQVLRLNSNYSLLNNFSLDLSFFPVFSMKKVDLVWKLWEIVLLNKSILIISDKPSISSEVVYLLQSLIFPIQFRGRYFPYFTIFDSELDNFDDPKSLHNNLIIGVTNPIFLKVA